MEIAKDFQIQCLLSEKDGKVSGPMSPLLFAQEMAKSADFKFNRLARVWFNDGNINQHTEDGGLTGHDTLIIGTVYQNDVWLSLWVDSGVGGMPVAMAYQSDREVEMTPVYEKAKYNHKLSVNDISDIFEYVFSKPEIIAIEIE